MPYRGRWDIVANPKGLVELAVDTATEIAIGDLLWLDVDDAKPFSHADLWTGSQAGSQAKAAEKFAGIANSTHVAGDTTTRVVRVYTRGTYAYPVQTAATFEVGDLVSASKDPAANLLQAQAVDKISLNPQSLEALAIGKVQRRYATSTSFVEFEIFTRLAAGGGVRNYLTS
jgi:hypothetical protein